jgi:DNA mismatch repair protein MutS
MPPKKKTAMVKPTMDKLYGDTYTTYTAKYGPTTAVLINVGSFYSAYDRIHVETGKSLRNVREIAEACAGAPRTESVEGEWNNVMWGFPEASCWRYEQLLVQAGFTVVFMGQDRDGTGAVTGRSLERVVSPGTYMDSTVAIGTEERRVVSVLVEAFKNRDGRPVWHMASTAFTVATGECVSTEHVVPITEGRPNLDSLQPFWSANAPSELAVWFRDCALTEAQVRQWFGFRGPIHMYEAPPKSAAATRGSLQYLHRIYANDTALKVGTYLDVENYQVAMESLTFLLRWIEDHNPSYLTNLRGHTMWQPEGELLLGNAALQQLGMLPLGKPSECLLHWLQRAITPMGKRALRERVVRPITDVEELELRQERVAALRGHDIRRHFHNMSDLPKLYRKFHMGKGDREALLGILTTCRKALDLAKEMEKNPMPAEAKEFVEGMLGMWDVGRLRACSTDHSYGIGPYHPWRRGFHADLDAMEDSWTAVMAEVDTLATEWNTLLDEEAVKVEWRKDEGVLCWTTTKRRAIALATVLKSRKKYVLDHTSKGTSTVAVLTSPHLTALSEKAKGVWDSWTMAVEEHWYAVWTAWEGNMALVDWIAEVDVDASLARCSEEYGYVRPIYVVQEDAGISVTDLRHPILERLTDVPYIPHSVSLGSLGSIGSIGLSSAAEIAQATNGILLYGVNAAGKSSLSKAIGLSILMAQIGMPVPATAMTLAPYNGLYTRILGNDNLWAGMSSFVVEMTELRTILAAGPKSLVLGDELCAGTETTSAIAIVGAGILRLVEKGAHFLFATHLHELLEMQEIAELGTSSKVLPYHLSVQAPPPGEHALIYDRVLRPGRGPAIYGLEVCRGLDMDKVFLEKAAELRRRWEKGVDLTKVSRYNAAVAVQVCDVCGAKEGLETHHIKPQAAANSAGFVAAGRHKNEKANLVILCEACHDKHHGGEMEVRGWVATSAGKKLDLGRFAYNVKK